MAEYGPGAPDAEPSGKHAEAVPSRAGRKPLPITPADALEIVTGAIVAAREAGVAVERFDMDGSPCVIFRGCKVEGGKLVLDK
jgi:phosphosulfolactate phosphohydrolase-like enzyme